MNARVATPETFDALVQEDGVRVFYFWGNECPNCEIFARDLPELIGELPAGAEVIKVNAYEHVELARRFGIAGIPAFVVFRDGKKLGMMRQYYGREYWVTVIKEAVNKDATT